MYVAWLSLSVELLFILTSNGINGLEDESYWREIASDELKEALNYKWNTNIAKNVILFVGDGMSIDTITASRIYNAGENGYLSWEKFPHVGMIKTYDVNKQVPDSASTATALFCGVKTNYEVVGVDANVPLADCEASLNSEYHLDSIISWAQKAGKDTGFVTTTRVTHATPAPLYAHAADRRWECEAQMPASAANCSDIARQLVENSPGKNIKVIMGGGRQMFVSNATGTTLDPLDTWACYSKDGRNLLQDWSTEKEERGASHRVVSNNQELWNVDTANTDFLMGIFANGHLAMDWERDTSPVGQPSLENMTTVAIEVLQKSTNGFFLMVEGGLIDYAHHRGHAAQALRETVRFSEAISAALAMVDTSETLIIVTSDHSHALTFNGVSDRGSDILGVAQNSRMDGLPYTTLGYSTGGPNNMAYEVVNGSAVRKDPTNENITSFEYSQQAIVITDEALHGGGDVAAYAIGPFAHLLHSTHEQHYVAHVIAYAAKIGQYSNDGCKINAIVYLFALLLGLAFL